MNNSSPNSAHKAQPLAYVAMPTPAGSAPVDPFQALDDLMVVVEALCPEWPARPAFTETGGWRL